MRILCRKGGLYHALLRAKPVDPRPARPAYAKATAGCGGAACLSVRFPMSDPRSGLKLLKLR